MSTSNNSAQRFGHSTFLRSSAVYGSGQQTVFSETNSSSHLRKNVDRSAIGGGNNNPLMMSTYQAQSQSALNSRTNSPARMADSPQRGGGGNNNNVHPNPSCLFTNTRQGNTNSPLRNSQRNNNDNNFNPYVTSSAAAYGASPSRNQTPTRSSSVRGSGAQTPERGRNPNPITGDNYQQGNTHTNANRRQAPPPNAVEQQQQQAIYRQQQQQPQNAYYIGSNANSRPNSPAPSGEGQSSRASSIGRRGSSVDSARTGNNNADGSSNYQSNGYSRTMTADAMPAAGVRRGAAANANTQQPPSVVSAGGRGRANTPTRRAESPFALHTDAYDTNNNNNNAVARGGSPRRQQAAVATTANNNNNNSGAGGRNGNDASSCTTTTSARQQQQQHGSLNTSAASLISHGISSAQLNRSAMGGGVGGIRRAGGQYSQNASSFHISNCGPAPPPGNMSSAAAASIARKNSPVRKDPAQMTVPAGVRTPRERFDESPHRTPTIRGSRENNEKIFAGTSANLIFSGGGDAAAGDSTQNSVSRNDTPERRHKRFVEPPVAHDKNGLWVRTKNKDNVTFLGVKGKGLPPPDGVEDDSFVVGRKIIPQPQNIEAAACNVVGEEKHFDKKGRRNPIPNKPYHGFVIPPYRVDKDALSSKILAELEPEVFMEPFGQGYRHRRHYDPNDNVREDIQQTHLMPTNNASGRVRGTALVPGKGMQVPGLDVLNLSKYTPEDLGERPHRHNYMVGPPAFVPEVPKPFAANQSYKPQRKNSFNSPTNVSQIDFGTTANVQRAAESPMRTSTPRGPKMGVYSPARNTTRPF